MEFRYDFCRKHAAQMLDLLDDMETLLQTDTHFLMGRWISDARATGNASYCVSFLVVPAFVKQISISTIDARWLTRYFNFKY